MTPERLEWIRARYNGWSVYASSSAAELADLVPELLDHIDELTRQLESARALAVASGIFQDHRGTDYDFDADNKHTWRATPVGPVAWDKQLEQP